ncbi:MAG TPA: choice-of-anchor P family protein [Acidimicrobiales bacterium]
MTRFRERHYSPAAFRLGLACAVVAAVCIVEFGSTSGADTTFIPGNAVATAQAISVAPTTGGLNYAITLGISISNYQDIEAQSLSQTIDLGAIGTALEAAGCSGGPPILDPKDVPAPVQAESVNGNQQLTSAITPAQSPIGVGSESANVTTQPTADSKTAVGAVTVPGNFLTISGLSSTTHASIDNGATRTATATSTIGSISLVNGLIQLGNLVWTATQQTGATSTSTATFSVGTLTVAGVTLDLSKLIPTTGNSSPQALLNILNTALSPVGFNIQWPAMTTLADGTVQISPLSIGIDNNTLGQEVIGSNLGSIQSLRSAIVNALLNVNCNFATGVLVGDIGIGVLAGGGNLNIQLGGASAATNDQAEQSPFGTGTLGAGTAPAAAPTGGNTGNTAPAAVAAAPVGNTGLGGLSTPGTAGTAGSTGAGGGAAKESLGPISKTSACVSLGPSGGGCSSGNVAVPIGLASLAVVVALFTWDYLRQRRRDKLLGAVEVAK